MDLPKSINNVTERVIDDMKQRITSNSRLSVAAASFSLYAYEALKKELEGIDELRFIFTSPTFIKDKVRKRSVSSIFHDLIVNAIFMVQILR